MLRELFLYSIATIPGFLGHYTGFLTGEQAGAIIFYSIMLVFGAGVWLIYNPPAKKYQRLFRWFI